MFNYLNECICFEIMVSDNFLYHLANLAMILIILSIT